MKRNGMCILCFLKKALVKPPRAKDIQKAEKYENSAAITPPMGWSSWNTFKNIIDQNVIYDTAVAMKESGLKDAGYRYINIDDNWVSSERDAEGNLQADLTRFYDGIPNLVNKINALGLKVGIYSSNGTLTCEDLPASLYNEKRDASTIANWGIEYFKYDFCHNEPISKYAPLLYGISVAKLKEKNEIFYSISNTSLTGLAKIRKNKSVPTGCVLTGLDENLGIVEYSNIEAIEDGEYTLTIEILKKGKYQKFLVAEVNLQDTYNIYFPSQKIWNKTARFQTKITLKKGLNTIKLYNPIRNIIDSAILQYRFMGKCLNDAAKNKSLLNNTTYKPIVFSICEWGFRKPWLWGAGAGNLWRTTPDIRPVWPWIMAIYERNVKLYNYSCSGAYNDPDMLEVGNGELTYSENIAHFSAWCMMNAPLILGNDIRNINKEVLDIVTNKEMIAINQDSLCKQAKRIKKGKCDILIKPLVNNKIAICFLNKFGNSKKISFSLETILNEEYIKPITLSDSIIAHDVWANIDTTINKTLLTKVAKHSAKVFILSSK